MIEGDNLLESKTFDNDPHIIKLPPPKENGALEFTLIKDRGATLTLDDGTIYRSTGIVMTNQMARSGYVTVLEKNGYTVISLVRSDAE